MEEPKRVIYEISIESVIKVLLLFASLWVAYLIKDVLMMMLVVLIFVMTLEPFVQKLSKQGIPRALSVIVLYMWIWSSATCIVCISNPFHLAIMLKIRANCCLI